MGADKFGERLRIAAQKVGGITALGRLSSISPSSLNGYIEGKNDPSRKKLVAIAEAAEVSLDWLAAGKGEMTPGQPTSPPEDHADLPIDPLINDIQTWLQDMTEENPNWRAWFEIELLQKIPAFKEWRESIKADSE